MPLYSLSTPSKVSPQSDYYSADMYFFEMITQKEPLDQAEEDARKELLSDLPIEIQNL